MIAIGRSCAFANALVSALVPFAVTMSSWPSVSQFMGGSADGSGGGEQCFLRWSDETISHRHSLWPSRSGPVPSVRQGRRPTIVG